MAKATTSIEPQRSGSVRPSSNLLTIAVGMLAWFVAKGVPAMIQWIYRFVTMRLEKAKRLISAEGLIATGSFTSFVSTDDIIKKSGVWAWLARRAIRSQTKRKMGLV